MSGVIYYVVQDAVHNLSSVAKSVQDLERIMVRIDRFLKVEDALVVVEGGTMDEKIEFAQFYVVKTYEPMNYVL
jgi:hypothetical protein